MFWFQFNCQQSRRHSTKLRYAQHSCGSGHTQAALCLPSLNLKSFWKQPSTMWPWANAQGLTRFTQADSQEWGGIFTEKQIETPLHPQRKSWFLEAAAAGEVVGTGVWGKGNTTSQEDTESSHERDLKAEIKNQFKRGNSIFREKWEVTSGQSKNSSSSILMSAWLWPVPPSKKGRCPDLTSQEKSDWKKPTLKFNTTANLNIRAPKLQHAKIQLPHLKITLFKGLYPSGS